MKNVLRIALPLTLWIIGFSAVYALQGFTCSRHWPSGLDARTSLIAAAAVVIVMQGLALSAVLWQPASSRFVQRTAMTLAAAALAAAIWTSLPLLMLTVCV